MERESQSAYSGLIASLEKRLPWYNFYTFCQRIEQLNPQHPPLGSTASVADDPLRFAPHPGMGFPAGELKKVEWDEAHPHRPPTVRTTFLGLYGVESPLPTAYQNDIAQRREGHEAVMAFLDIFNHRFTTQYYRIWRKYAYPATYRAGGTDNISQYLLGLVGLGIPGSQHSVPTPLSRFLALLATMRLPTRTAEGMIALVSLLAPATRAQVEPWSLRRLPLTSPARLSKGAGHTFRDRLVLGKTASDVNTQVELKLFTEDPQEARAWLPGQQLHTDLLALLRVYLGWRSDVRLTLSLPCALLPAARLGREVQAGLTGMLGSRPKKTIRGAQTVTVSLGFYRGLRPNDDSQHREIFHGSYRF